MPYPASDLRVVGGISFASFFLYENDVGRGEVRQVKRISVITTFGGFVLFLWHLVLRTLSARGPASGCPLWGVMQARIGRWKHGTKASAKPAHRTVAVRDRGNYVVHSSWLSRSQRQGIFIGPIVNMLGLVYIEEHNWNFEVLLCRGL